MINFKYEHISKIMDLAQKEIDKLEQVKKDLYPNKPVATIDAEAEEIMNADSRRFDDDINILKEIKNGFDQELKKISFSFGMGGRNNQEEVKEFQMPKPGIFNKQ